MTETSRINADLQLVSEGTPRFQFPSPDLHHFPSLYSCFRCHCLSFGHYPKSTDLSFFWDNGGMASFLRVATLWIWIQPCKNGIPISWCDVVLRIASLNPYTTIPFKRELFLVSKKKKDVSFTSRYCYINFLFKSSSSPALNWERQARILIILVPWIISGTSEASAASVVAQPPEITIDLSTPRDATVAPIPGSGLSIPRVFWI